MSDNDWVAGISKKDAGRYSRQLLVDDFGVSGKEIVSFWDHIHDLQAKKT